jgi:hypothetical protein
MEDRNKNAANTWEPGRTWVVAVGVIEGSWPTETRRDTVLIETLKARGVREEQVLFLADSEASIETVEQQMTDHLAQASEGDLAIIYFTGYSRSDDGVHFVLADGDWSIHRVFALLEQHFSGARVLLLGDTAYSGALAAELPLRTGRLAYAALTSSLPGGRSTSTWIYTNSLIEAFNGEAIDSDSDGYLDLSDVAAHVEHEMASDAGKLPTFATSGGFPTSLRLIPVKPREQRGERVGEYVEARDRWGGWVPARIDEEREGEYLVRYCDYLTNPRAWVPASHVRPRDNRVIPVGESVQVTTSDWALGTVVASRAGLYLVHYDSDQEDEWVSGHQLRMPPE